MSREPHRLPPDGSIDGGSQRLRLVVDIDHPEAVDFGWRLSRGADARHGKSITVRSSADVPPLIAWRISIWVAEALLESERSVDRYRPKCLNRPGTVPNLVSLTPHAGATRQQATLLSAASNDNQDLGFDGRPASADLRVPM